MNLRVLSQKHNCNGCTVCCDLVAVCELGKPFYTRCENQLERGCGIYVSRPQSCRDFSCAWAAGLLGEGETWRPDRSGILFFLRRYEDGLWLEIFEAVPGAASDVRRIEYLVVRIVARVEKSEKVIGTRLHHFGDPIALGFDADLTKYPNGAAVSRKMNRYARINGDVRRQVFVEAHDPP